MIENAAEPHTSGARCVGRFVQDNYRFRRLQINDPSHHKFVDDGSINRWMNHKPPTNPNIKMMSITRLMILLRIELPPR